MGFVLLVKGNILIIGLFFVAKFGGSLDLPQFLLF